MFSCSIRNLDYEKVFAYERLMNNAHYNCNKTGYIAGLMCLDSVARLIIDDQTCPELSYLLSKPLDLPGVSELDC